MNPPSKDDPASRFDPRALGVQALSLAEEVADLMSQGLITPAEAAGITDEELEVLGHSCELALEVGALAEAICLAQGLTTLSPYLPWGYSLCAQAYRQAGLTQQAKGAQAAAQALAGQQPDSKQPPTTSPQGPMHPQKAGMAETADVLEPWLQQPADPRQGPADVFTLGDGRPLPLPPRHRRPLAQQGPAEATAPATPQPLRNIKSVEHRRADEPGEVTQTMKGPAPVQPQLLEEQTTVTAVVRRRRGLDLTDL